MNTQIGIRNPCNIFRVVFKSLYPTILVWKDTMEMQEHYFIVLFLPPHLILAY